MNKKFSAGLLMALTLLALCLRVTGLGFGLPYAEARPDEILIIKCALGYGSGDLNPHFFYYPSLMSYLVFLAYGVYATGLLLAGQIHSLRDILIDFAANPSPYFLIPRGISALLGALTVPALFLLCRRMTSDRIAFLAAGLLAVVSLHIRDSHFGSTDVPMTALTVATMIPVMGILGQGKRRDYVMAGLLAGLAVSFKYNAALLALPIFLAHLWAPGKKRESLILAALCMVGAFLLTSPFVLLDWHAFLTDFKTDMWLLSGRGESNVGRGWIRHGAVNLRYGVGVMTLVMAVLGALSFWREKRKECVVILAFPILYYLLVGRGYAGFARYIVPVVPFVCILAALGAGWVFRSLKGVIGRKGAAVVAAIVVVVMIVPQFIKSCQLDRLFLGTDTREMAVKYVEKSLAVGAEVGWVGTRYGRPLFPETGVGLEKRLSEARGRGESGRMLEARLAVAHQRGGGVSVRELSLADLTTGQLPPWIFVEYYPLAYTLKATTGADALLDARGYRRVAEFSGAPRTVLDAAGMVYDVQDSFYMPYAGMNRVMNPGPQLTLWGK